MPLIIITRADEVKAIIQSRTVAAVLSIEHPGVQQGQKGYAPRLEDTEQLILCFWDSEQTVANGPDRAQVEAGLNFVMEQLQKGDVIIHCHAGKSRSTALALGALALQNPDMNEEALVELLLEIRPQAAPNIIVVELVDELTGRGGKLVEAVLNHPTLSAQRATAEENRQWLLRENPEILKKLHPEKFVNNPPPKP